QRMARIHVPDGLAQLPDLDPAEPVSEHLDRAAGRVRLGATQAQQRALARPDRADEGPALARPDRDRDVRQELIALADEVDVAQAQHLRWACSHVRSRSRTPGFNTPAGSSASLAARSAAANRSGRCSRYQGT